MISPAAAAESLAVELARPLTLSEVLQDELAGKLLPRDPATPQEAEEDARLKTIHEELHRQKRSALCLSGGGIRSATFNLGIIQELAQTKLLGEFDYLSTVSGGGYIGGWLSAWISRKGLGDVITGLNKDRRDSSDATQDPESGPIRHLRRFSNYLTPKLGLFSADTWTVAGIVFRNIFLNWLMLIPIIAAVLMVPRLFAALALQLVADLPTICGFVGAALLLMAVTTAYSAIDLPKWREAAAPPGEGRRRKSDGLYHWLCLIPLAVASSLLSLSWILLCGKFPHLASALGEWQWDRLGAPFFLYAVIGASYLGGMIAMLSLGKYGLGVWRETVALVLTSAAGGLGFWWVATQLFAGLEPYRSSPATLNFISFAPALGMLVYLLMNFFYVGTFSRFTESEDREWFARSAGWILLTALGLAVGFGLVIWGPIGMFALWQDHSWIKTLAGTLGGIGGIASALIGFSSRSAAQAKEGPGSSNRLLALVASAFIALLLVAIALGTAWLLAKFYAVQTASPQALAGVPVDFRAFYPTTVLFAGGWGLGIVAAAFVAVGVLIGWAVNVNQFSLHAMYRSRLVRAYLGASRGDDRQPHWFTGLDARDAVEMSELSSREPRRKLFHVVNIAMNLVGGKELAWQERKAQSFTVSPLHAGSWCSGYRPSKLYGKGIGLGTAMTISGAAANPNMGYNSSPLVTFLMTLFNVRLGWWVGNPGEPGRDTWKLAGPSHAALPLISEAFGKTTKDYPYVNLSDGGHFENLGLYEMILRRCHRIVVIDAGRDKGSHFEDLGNAIRKIRIDFGITIEIAVNFIAPDGNGAPLARCALGKIHYPQGDHTTAIGSLIYIKPVLRRDEPVDIRHYAAAHPEFPHETTNDQWFSESQLESYRMLGSYTFQDICAGKKEFRDLEEFFEHVAKSCEVLGKPESTCGGIVAETKTGVTADVV